MRQKGIIGLVNGVSMYCNVTMHHMWGLWGAMWDPWGTLVAFGEMQWLSNQHTQAAPPPSTTHMPAGVTRTAAGRSRGMNDDRCHPALSKNAGCNVR